MSTTRDEEGASVISGCDARGSRAAGSRCRMGSLNATTSSRSTPSGRDAHALARPSRSRVPVRAADGGERASPRSPALARP